MCLVWEILQGCWAAVCCTWFNSNHWRRFCRGSFSCWRWQQQLNICLQLQLFWWKFFIVQFRMERFNVFSWLLNIRFSIWASMNIRILCVYKASNNTTECLWYLQIVPGCYELFKCSAVTPFLVVQQLRYVRILTVTAKKTHKWLFWVKASVTYWQCYLFTIKILVSYVESLFDVIRQRS